MAALHCHHHICAKLMPSIQEPYIFSRFKILISSSIPSPSSSFIARCHPPPCSRIFHKTLYRRGYCTTSAIAGSSEDSSISVSSKSATSPISTFFAGDGVSWKSLGVSDDLSSALSNVSLQGPSLVQASCIPPIFSGKDVVVAAQTGSGKTHGYLVPLIEKIYKSVSDDQVISGNHKTASLILCPNVMLCEQVVKMANSLCNDCANPLVSVYSVCGQHGWPVEKPDIIVSTPVALLNSLYALGAGRRRRPEFIRDVKYIVFDEADMLLCGGFQNQIIRLINLLRFEEKQLSKMEKSMLDNSPKKDIELASTTIVENPVSSMVENDDVSSNAQGKSTSSEFENDFSLSETSQDQQECNGQDLVSNAEDVADIHDIREDPKSEENTLTSTRGGKDWRRARKLYKRSKQYIFVAATLPESGRKTAGGVLKHMFPDAIWVSGDYLHCHNPSLEQRWVEVSIDTQVDSLLEAVKHSSKLDHVVSASGTHRTMVFANTIEAAEAVAKILQQFDIEYLCYHSDSTLEERKKKLVSFSENGGVLVCTDAAARGLDIPNVSHVIQAEFATSAVDFLHRVGRTGRAGHYGVVTSLYTESNRDLVSAVRQAEKLGQPVENAFSRKRSFRNKLKKRGVRYLKDPPPVEAVVA